jgi:hypothetical protein
VGLLETTVFISDYTHVLWIKPLGVVSQTHISIIASHFQTYALLLAGLICCGPWGTLDWACGCGLRAPDCVPHLPVSPFVLLVGY